MSLEVISKGIAKLGPQGIHTKRTEVLQCGAVGKFKGIREGRDHLGSWHRMHNGVFPRHITDNLKHTPIQLDDRRLRGLVLRESTRGGEGGEAVWRGGTSPGVWDLIRGRRGSRLLGRSPRGR